MGINYVMAMPIAAKVEQVVAKALIHRVIGILAPPQKVLSADKDSAFMEEVIQLILRLLNCKLEK